MTALVVTSDGNGNVSLHIDSAANIAPRPPASATVSISGGPIAATGAGQYIDWIAANDSTSGLNTAAIFFNGLIEVKD